MEQPASEQGVALLDGPVIGGGYAAERWKLGDGLRWLRRF
jgi:hypothetical protein